MSVISKLILSSVNPYGTRIDTFQVWCPIPVWYEILTHRLFCRNASSTRAIPLKKMRSLVEADPAIPVKLTKFHKGMMANESLDSNADYIARGTLKHLLYSCIDAQTTLEGLGVSKQDANLTLLPFIHFQGLITATEFNNFFNLRNNKEARPDLQLLADSMQKQYDNASSQFIDYGEWHLPYITEEDKLKYPNSENLKAISTARCCRISFLLSENNDESELEKDTARKDSLITSGHWSPLEHLATPLPLAENGDRYMVGQYVGWMSYRKFFPEETNGDLQNVSILTGEQARKLF